MKEFAKYMIRCRIQVILLTMGVTLFFGMHLSHLKISSDFVKSLPDSDPEAVLYKQIGKKYQGADVAMIVLETNNIYTTEVLGDIKRITDTLMTLREVQWVTSLTHVFYIHADSTGIETGLLIEPGMFPRTGKDFLLLKKRVEENPLYVNSLVSEDGSATMILFTLSGEVNQQEVALKVKKMVAEIHPSGKIYFGGFPMMLLDMADLIITDITVLTPLVTLVLLVVLFFSFRSAAGILLPLLSVAVSCVWTMGLMSLLDYELTMVGGVIPVVLFAVGSAYAIHVVNRSILPSRARFRETLVTGLASLILPVFLSSLTTSFGFISFVFGSYLTMIRDFGIFAAAGTFFSFVVSVSFVPALLSFLPEKISAGHRTQDPGKGVLTGLVYLKKLIFRYPLQVLVLWFLFVTVALVYAFRLERNTNIIMFFKPGNPTRISEEILQEKFGGSSPVYVRFKGDMQDPAVLQGMNNMEEFLMKNPYVTFTMSVAGLIKEMNDAMGEGKIIPEDRTKIEQLWFLLEGQEVMTQLVSEDLQEGIIQARFASVKSDDTRLFVESVTRFIAENPISGCQVRLSGMPSIYLRMDKSLLRSQITSITLAVLLVFLLLGFSMRSFRLGLAGIVPICATVILLFGFMGAAEIPLDIATVLVAGVALGIGIDYSIHVLSAFKNYLKEQGTPEKAIEKTILVNGRAVFINAVSVASGFLVLLFSQVVPVQFFGLLVAISMVASALGALTLLPAILIIRNKWSETLLKGETIKK